MIFSRLELDIMQANELRESVELAYKYNLPAVVVHPNLVPNVFQARGVIRGKFKIVVPVDWPKGEAFGTIKFRGLPADAMEADGFEVMLTPDKTELETRQEAIAITEFVKKQISDQTEVRFVLGTYSNNSDNLAAMCRGLLHVRTPALLRFDTQLKLQVSKANTDEHNRIIKTIREHTQIPVKATGNIAGVRSVTGCGGASRFGVSLLQARIIVKEHQQQPNDLKNLLNNQQELDADDTMQELQE